MLIFSKAIKIRVLCANLVEITIMIYQKGWNPKLDNFAISVWEMNLVKNQEFIGQLGKNQPLNIALQ